MENIKQTGKKKKLKSFKAKGKWHWMGIAGFVYLCIWVAFLYFRLGWAFIKSIQDLNDFILTGSSATSWPTKFSFDAYAKVLTVIKYEVRATDGTVRTVYMFQMVMNSLLFSVLNTMVPLIVTMCVAYVTARHDFWFNKVVVGIFYFQMLVPIVGAMSSSLKILKELGLFDSWIGYCIQRYNFFGGILFLILRDAFQKLANSYADAAKIDGAGNFQIMVQICFPLVKALWMMYIMTGLISSWNNYSAALVYLPSYPTVAYGLYMFNKAKSGGENSEFAYMPYKLAGFMLLLLPTTVFYLTFKEKMLGATTSGGLKE